MENTYDLRELALLLLSKIRLILTVTFLCAACAFLFSSFLMSKKYESYTSMYVKNSAETTQTFAGNINLSDLTASKSLVDTYAAVLMSSSVMNETGKRLVEQFDSEELAAAFSGSGSNGFSLRELLAEWFPFIESRTETVMIPNLGKYITITSVNSTEVMRISAVTKNPDVSAAICNIIADMAPEFLIRVVGAGSVEVIDPAEAIPIPVSPNVKLLTLLGGFLGLAFVVTIVWVIDFFDDTVRDAEKLSERFDKPLLGEIQRLDPKEVKKSTRKKKGRQSGERSAQWLITDENVPFNAVESYKTIRTSIMFSLATTQKRAFVISSPNPGDGKSTTSANTALAFAQASSNRVLLIDADMRKPVMHKLFHTDNSTGLSTLVGRMSTEEESIRRDVAEKLDLLPSGPLPPNPSELLASSQFQLLLEKLHQMYDYIIIDTPPVNVVSDAMVMHEGIGGIIIVVNYSVSTYEDVMEVIKRANTSGANVLGFVVNNVSDSKPGSYSHYKYKYEYGYGYGYSYGNRRQNGVTEDRQTLSGGGKNPAEQEKTPAAI